MTSGLKKLVRVALPRELLDAVWRHRATRPLQEIDLAVIRLILGCDLARLHDESYLERELLPALGLNGENLDELPSHLHAATAHGLRFWQYPVQFAPYLVHLASLAPRSYLEIGVRHGGTFVLTTEYLGRVTGLGRSVAVDLGAPPTILGYVSKGPGRTFLQLNSRAPDFTAFLCREGPFDVVFIDGDHSPEGVRRDVETVTPYARALVLHDIVSDVYPGPGAVWREMRAEQQDHYVFTEFVTQYDEVVERTGKRWMGIGVAVRLGP